MDITGRCPHKNHGVNCHQRRQQHVGRHREHHHHKQHDTDEQDNGTGDIVMFDDIAVGCKRPQPCEPDKTLSSVVDQSVNENLEMTHICSSTDSYQPRVVSLDLYDDTMNREFQSDNERIAKLRHLNDLDESRFYETDRSTVVRKIDENVMHFPSHFSVNGNSNIRENGGGACEAILFDLNGMMATEV